GVHARSPQHGGGVAGAPGARCAACPDGPGEIQWRKPARTEGHRDQESRLCRCVRVWTRARTRSGGSEERRAATHRFPGTRMTYSRIKGTGSYLPPRAVPNREFEQRLDTSDEWIRARTGIAQRYIADEDQTSSDLALEACRAALRAADI